MSKLEEEFRTSVATDKLKYINIWSDHINQLEILAGPLLSASKEDELYKELVDIKFRLKDLVFIAADEDFK